MGLNAMALKFVVFDCGRGVLLSIVAIFLPPPQENSIFRDRAVLNYYYSSEFSMAIA